MSERDMQQYIDEDEFFADREMVRAEVLACMAHDRTLLSTDTVIRIVDFAIAHRCVMRHAIATVTDRCCHCADCVAMRLNGGTP